MCLCVSVFILYPSTLNFCYIHLSCNCFFFLNLNLFAFPVTNAISDHTNDKVLLTVDTCKPVSLPDVWIDLGHRFVWVETLEQWQWKGTPYSTKLQDLSLTIRCCLVSYPGHLWGSGYPTAAIQSAHSTIQANWALIGRVLPLCRDIVSIFYTPSQMGLLIFLISFLNFTRKITFVRFSFFRFTPVL